MNLKVAIGRAFLSLGHTWRVEWHGLEHIERARQASPAGNIIYALWHSGLTILSHTHRDRDVQVLVSQHRDGEIIARILESMGYGLVRGSTHRGGLEALFGLAKQLERGRDVAIAVDGPMGPRYCVHPGALLLARRTGRPVVPVIATARHCRFLDTWDAQRLPYPWTRVRVQHAEALWLPEERDAGILRQAQQELETRLRRETLAEERFHGRGVDLRDVQDRRSYWERVSERDDPPWGARLLSTAHAAARQLERRLRPRPRGRGTRPWVVGIGNLEAGGTGKTPCVITLACAVREAGLRLGVLTRGHGGTLGGKHPVRYAVADYAEASDETRLLAQALPSDIMLVVARNKRCGLEFLASRGDLDVVLVDDAFQTAGLRVDRHLVLLDWENPLGNGHLLPAGRLRESPRALRRAQALLFTRVRGDGLPRHPAWAHVPPAHCFRARERVGELRNTQGARVELESLRGQGVALLSGLGRPQAFENAVQELAERGGFRVHRIVRVGDHAPLEAQLDKLSAKLRGIGCAAIVTSRKDLMRLQHPRSNDEPLLVLEQRLEVDALGELLAVLLPRLNLRRRSWRSSPTTRQERGFPRPS